MVVAVVGFFSMMLANYTGLSHEEFPELNAEIEGSFEAAIASIQPGVEHTRVINQWRIEPTVHNTFYAGYCTYGAALISPEFFPYLTPTQQQRTW